MARPHDARTATLVTPRWVSRMSFGRRCFHDQQLNERKCCSVITELLYLLSQGDKFTAKESTEVFFAVR